MFSSADRRRIYSSAIRNSSIHPQLKCKYLESQNRLQKSECFKVIAGWILVYCTFAEELTLYCKKVPFKKRYDL